MHIVLADPICAPKHFPIIIRKFIEKFQNVIFVQITTGVADVISDLNYQVNRFGTETELPVHNFSLAGKARAKLRQWRNKCEREGVEVREQCISQCQNIEEIKKLSDEWLKEKGGHELTFLTRSFKMVKEEDVRYFWAYQNDRLIAFAVFDPIYENGNVVGYYHNFDRISKDVPHGTSAYIILEAMKQFQQDNIRFVSLGLSPLYKLGDKYPHNHFTRLSLQFAFLKLNFLYPFQGNASHKKKFNGNRKPVYFSSTEGNNLWQFFVLMKALGMF
jgi:phosphatidylglycerol lysyltransferase